MSDTLTAPPAAATPPDPGLATRLLGVIFSPYETFAAVAVHPRWFGVLALTLAVGAGCQYAIMSSPDLQDALIDQQVRVMETRGGASAQQVAAVEQFIGNLPVINAAMALVVGPFMVAAIAGILMWVFTALLGGSGTFKQVFAILAHSGVISTLSGVFTAILVASGVPPNGIRPPGANLGVFVPMLEDTSFVAVMLSSIDLFLLWWLIALAIGLAVLYRRRSGGIATALIGVYVTIALLIAIFTSGA